MDQKTCPQPSWNLETVQATLAACEWDLQREEDRMQGLDAKLTQLAAFSGVSISITGSVGGSVVAAQRLDLGWLIALGSILALSGVLLLLAVGTAFRWLSPKAYRGVDEQAVVDRTLPSALKRPAEEALVTFVGTRRDVLIAARAINDKKAKASRRAYVFAGLGLLLLVVGIIVTVVGAVT